MADIQFSGGEVSLLKTMGISGATVRGEILMGKLSGFAEAEVLDLLQGLIMTGYVLSSKENLRTIEDMMKADLRVNSNYSKQLKEALNPRKKVEKKPRRQRRE